MHLCEIFYSPYSTDFILTAQQRSRYAKTASSFNFIFQKYRGYLFALGMPATIEQQRGNGWISQQRCCNDFVLLYGSIHQPLYIIQQRNYLKC